MLLPRYFSPHVQRTHRLGFVGEPTELVSLHVDQLVKVIPTPVPTYEDLENFIRSILECEAILSTSYYGKVIADAYGVPAQWCTFASNRSDELALTHVDYDEAYGRGQQHVSLELHHDEDINLSLAARFNTATGFTPHTDDYLAAFTDAIGNLQTNKFGV